MLTTDKFYRNMLVSFVNEYSELFEKSLIFSVDTDIEKISPFSSDLIYIINLNKFKDIQDFLNIKNITYIIEDIDTLPAIIFHKTEVLNLFINLN